MEIIHRQLFAKDPKGRIRDWSITGETNGYDGLLTITYGVLGGGMTEKLVAVDENMSGRDINEQVHVEAMSRIHKMMDKGYVHTIEEANEPRTNTLRLPRPMLATPFKKVRNIEYDDAYVQIKYDGHRCLIAKRDGELIAYSRNGKRIRSINHILRGLDIPEGTILDGELYIQDTSLQKLSSLIKREQPKSAELKYHVYDQIKDREFFNRYFEVADMCCYAPNVVVAPTYSVGDYYETMEYFTQFREKGEEGAILRWGDAPYEDTKRSKGVVKIKGLEDAEFMVHKITPSKDGWAVLHMRTTAGVPFKASAPGCVTQKAHIYYNREEYIGRYVTIEFARLTDDGAPFNPIAKCWRDE